MKTFLATIILMATLTAQADIALVADNSASLGMLSGYETAKVELSQVRDAIKDCIVTTNELAQEMGADVDQENVLTECREANGL